MPSRHLRCSAQVIFSGFGLAVAAFCASLVSAVAASGFASGLASFVASAPGFSAGPTALPLLSLPASGLGLPVCSGFGASPAPAPAGFFAASPAPFLDGVFHRSGPLRERHRLCRRRPGAWRLCQAPGLLSWQRFLSPAGFAGVAAGAVSRRRPCSRAGARPLCSSSSGQAARL